MQWGRKAELVKVKLVVHIVTTEIRRVKKRIYGTIKTL